MEEPASARLFDYFAHVSDPRSANARHHLFDIFVIALCAVISGAEGWEDMEEYGQAQAEWSAQFLSLFCHSWYANVLMLPECGPSPVSGVWTRSMPRAPTATVSVVDQYCAPYRTRLTDVRRVEQFPALPVGLIAALPRKTLPAMARAVGVNDAQPFHHFLTPAPWQAADCRAQRLQWLQHV